MRNHPKVIFIVENAWERPAKLAFGLRENGVPVLLLHILPLPFDAKLYFDYSIQCNNTNECLEIARRLKPEIAHIFSYTGDQTCIAVLESLDAKVVFDYKDVFENIKPGNPEVHDTQRMLIEKANGLCCRDRQMELYLRVNDVKPRGKMIIFPDYCYGLPMQHPPKIGGDDEIHVVTIGSFLVEQCYPQYSAHGWLEIAKTIVNQGIHFHMYPSGYVQNVLNHVVNQLGDSQYHQLARENSFFHLHNKLPLEQLLSELSQYDFGLLLLQGEIFGIPDNYMLDQDSIKYGCSTRMFDYIEAGLDVLIQDSLLYQATFLKQYNFGQLVDKNYILENLFEKLKKLKLDKERHSQIARARKNMAIGNHVQSLINFYSSL